VIAGGSIPRHAIPLNRRVLNGIASQRDDSTGESNLRKEQAVQSQDEFGFGWWKSDIVSWVDLSWGRESEWNGISLKEWSDNLSNWSSSQMNECDGPEGRSEWRANSWITRRRCWRRRRRRRRSEEKTDRRVKINSRLPQFRLKVDPSGS